MNIAVLKPSGNYCFRPDSTLNREAADYYIPDGIDALTLTPCIYTRLVRAGKCIGERFAQRYADNFGFGVLLDAAGADPFEALCMDSTSYLSGQTGPMSEIGDAAFEVCVNGEALFRHDAFNAAMLYDALVKISSKSTLRASDLVAVCLPSSIILKRGDCFSFGGHEVKIL